MPVGVVAAILPTTNPTSTAIYKRLISLKAGNAIVISPHPNAKRCTCETARILYQAALEAGAPEDIIQCITTPTLEATNALMRHERTGVILSTGGPGSSRRLFERQAGVRRRTGQCSGDARAHGRLADADRKIVEGKSFDFGTVCSSEQAVVAEEPLRDRVIAELKARKAYFCNEAQKDALAKLLLTPHWTVNPKCVGQARAENREDGRIRSSRRYADPGGGTERSRQTASALGGEAFAGAVAVYREGFCRRLDICESLLRFGGLGHTCVIHSKDDARIREYGCACRRFACWSIRRRLRDPRESRPMCSRR